MSTHAPTVLERILQGTRAELERRKREVSPQTLARRAGERTGGGERRLARALSRTDIGVIAEFKRRSPSAGTLREGADAAEIAKAYERGGAVAMSVLTDGPSFGGSLDDLRAARSACELPILRKDFVIDPYQLHEAREAGADAVLLIVAALTPEALASLQTAARELGLDALVEVHDSAELDVALQVEADLIGINNRDLRDFSVDVERTARLMADVPAGVTTVSESGIDSRQQLERLRREGVHGVLIGEALMRADDPELALRTFIRSAPAL